MQKNRLGNFPTRFIIEPFYTENQSSPLFTKLLFQTLYRLLLFTSEISNSTLKELLIFMTRDIFEEA